MVLDHLIGIMHCPRDKILDLNGYLNLLLRQVSNVRTRR